MNWRMTILAIIALVAPGTAVANGTVQSVRIGGYVPAACRVSAAPSADSTVLVRGQQTVCGTPILYRVGGAAAIKAEGGRIALPARGEGAAPTVLTVVPMS